MKWLKIYKKTLQLPPKRGLRTKFIKKFHNPENCQACSGYEKQVTRMHKNLENSKKLMSRGISPDFHEWGEITGHCGIMCFRPVYDDEVKCNICWDRILKNERILMQMIDND